MPGDVHLVWSGLELRPFSSLKCHVPGEEWGLRASNENNTPTCPLTFPDLRSPPVPSFQWTAAPVTSGEMGCTPSKSAVIYSQDKVCRDLDTCSTFVSSLKSSVSTPEKPRLCVENSNGRQTFLSGEFMVPSWNQISTPDPCDETAPGCSTD